MARPKHFCGKCGERMEYDRFLSIKSKRITAWWCFNCELIEVYVSQKVHNAVTSVRRFVFFGKLGQNPKQ